MNKQLYRLVFSKHLGMFVPASEAVRSNTCKSAGSRLRGHRRLLAIMLAATGMQAITAVAAQPAGLVKHATKAWTNAAIDAARTSANQMTIKQTASKAVLNWQQLNLDKGQTLNFDQGGNSSWAALNRIFDLNPSVISGAVNATGHIYFVNSNGIVFGNGAQINVGSLTATSLDNIATDAIVDRFNDGILSDKSTAAFVGTGGFVRVEQGAAISAASGGRVMLLAPNVENSGVITTVEGQTILAAGQKVYLGDSADPAGLLVEVEAGGTAKNLGEIVAKRGNVTLVGLAVNQGGRITASTSVRANGSIHLLANTRSSGTSLVNRDGVVTLAQGSKTVIDVETSDKEEALDALLLNPSRVQIEGKTIDIDGEIVAHGGQVLVNPLSAALIVPSTFQAPRETLAGTRIHVGAHALIDVSGVDAVAPMSRNQLELELFSDQLKDTPILRGGPLFAQKIYVDARNLSADQSKNLLDFQPIIALKTKTIAERLSVGGSVVLNASPVSGDSGEVLIANGSVIDVSGGSITYEAGYLRESSVLFNGKRTLVSQANRNTPYQGLADVYSVTDDKWGVTRTWNLSPSVGSYASAYTDGSRAGGVTITGKNFVLGGDFKAETMTGLTQRKSPPAGGSFSLVQKSLSALDSPLLRVVAHRDMVLPDGFAALGTFDAATSTYDAGDTLSLALKGETQVETSLFDRGFQQVELSGGASDLFPFPTLPTFSSIVVDGEINANPDSKLTLMSYSGVAINADITLPSGDITIQGDGVNVAERVHFSTAGLFTNDKPIVVGALKAPVAQDGGSLKITSKDILGDTLNPVVLGTGSHFDAGAGAWLDAEGKFNQGKAGNITMTGLRSVEQNQFQSYGFDKGGALTLGILGDVQIGGSQASAGLAQWLPESFFTVGGFSAFNVTASSGPKSFLASEIADPDLVVAAGAIVQPQMQTLVRHGYASLLPSGTAMMDVANPVLLPASQRTPVSISLAAFDELTIAENAVIRLDAPSKSGIAGGAINLNSQRQLSILGNLIAPAGSISATIAIHPEQAINNNLTLFVGENATLSATGHYAVAPPDGKGILNATVFNGGTIKLQSDTLAVLKEGSLLDVSGVSGDADIAVPSGLSRQTLYGAAGSIIISAPFVLDGELKGEAQGTGAGGTLDLTMIADGKRDPAGVPLSAGALNFTQDKSGILAAGLNPGDVYADSLVLQNEISASQVTAGGFDRLNASIARGRADDKITLSSGLNLQVPVALTLSAPQLEVTGNGTARLAASNVTLQSGFSLGTAPALVAGTATLQVAADFINLQNKTVITGVAHTELYASNDIRGVGVGSLKAPGELLLRARQVYPSTLSQFTFEAVDVDASPVTRSSIRVESSGATPKPVLSANGSMTLKADDIIQGGVLLAPLGKITLDAADTDGTITLIPGSLTSVSAISADGKSQLIPYGLTGLSGLNFSAPDGRITNTSTVPGEGAGLSFSKLVTLDADKIEMQAGATIDLSGGGDTMTYEFINGVGGTTDTLGQAGVYAILPTAQGEYAPYDPSYQQTTTGLTDLKLGDAVYLAGIPGLKEGTYTLLPGRYALLPGAYMLQTSSSKVLPGQSLAQLDGSMLVSGYRTTLEGSSRDATYSTFKITDGNVFRTNVGTKDFKGPAEYRLNTGNQLHAELALAADLDIPRLAFDAGQLVLNAGNSLALRGQLLAKKQDGARGALVDIVADNIRVVSSEGANIAGTIQVTADSLNALDVESLLLGGTRTVASTGQTITTTATEVSFANDADHALEVAELIATAKNTVRVESGAEINAVSDAKTTGKEILNTSGDGALLAVSAVNNLTFNRIGSAGVLGTLDIASGAMVNAGRSLVLDSTSIALPPILDGNINVSNGGSATLGANLIQLGNPAIVSGMLVDNALIASLGNLSLLTLNSKQNLEIHGTAILGNGDLDITFNTSGIKGTLAVGESATITADTFTLKNTTGVTSVDATGDGTLNVAAKYVVIEGRALAATGTPVIGVGGFNAVNFAAQGEVKFNGVGETQINAATTTITSARLTAGSGSVNALKASGVLNTAAVVNPTTLAAADGLGGSLKLEAASLNLAGDVELPSGQFTAIASTGDINVSGNIKAASLPVQFDRFTRYTPGGVITLESTLGNVTVATGATLDVSADSDARSDADAGTLNIRAISATKTATINGTLLGNAGDAGGDGGRFNLDVNTLGDFAALNDKLNAGEFSASREMRLRTGDLTIFGTGAQALKAEQVVLALDAGNLTVTGEIDATAAKNSRIGLYARDGLTLTNTARLKANSTEAGAEGGAVELATTGVTVSATATASSVTNATTGGSINLQAGSDINVSGGAGGAGGQVRLRAPRLASGLAAAGNADINITAVAGTFTGASKVQAEGFRVYSDNSIATADFSTTGAATTWYKEAETFLKSVTDDAGVGLNRLGKFGDPIFAIVPGVEVRNIGGDVALANDWSLHNWRFDRDDGTGVTAAGNLTSGLDTAGHELLSGILTLRASGNLNFNNTLSDGFSSVTLATSNNAQGLAAWSYNLVGGADFTAANLLSTKRAATDASGNATTGKVALLGTNKGIRTGAGDIRIAAGGDLNMFDSTSVIYSAGRKVANFSGFVNPATPFYATDGGDLDIRVQNNVNGKTATGNKQQTVNDWLLHQGGGLSEKQVSWWVRPDLFKQGVATFGGGDVTIRAEGNITSFSASAATTARYASDTNFEINGGGDVTVAAGNDILSGVYYAGRGDVRINAGGEIKESGTAFGTTVALQDGGAEVSAVRGAYIHAALNPTIWVQGLANGGAASSPAFSNFLTMNENSDLRLSSLVGNVRVGSAGSTTLSSGSTIASSIGNEGSGAFVFPATVEVTAFGGDVTAKKLTLLPAANGNLSLLAAEKVTADQIVLSDADSTILPTASSVAKLVASGEQLRANSDAVTAIFTPLQTNHASTPVHQNDSHPVEIVARDGSIAVTGNTTNFFSKPVYLHASQDINFSGQIQHANSSDISVVDAGRDFSVGVGDTNKLQVSGPGELLVQAKRNINLGKTEGILTVGNAVNPNLPDEGASVSVLAGLGLQGADLVAYIDTYLDPTGAGPAILQSDAVKLAEYRKATSEALAAYMRKATNNANLSDADAISQYLASDMDKNRQSVFAYRHFSSELLAAGKASKVDRGDNAIATLFPNSRTYDGDVSLFQSQIRTLSNGSIDLLAPGGLINVGVPVSSGSKIGIVTEFGGAIRAFAETGFQVEQSKVITQYGSDITVWVNNGNIDAGRGSKSAVSAPDREVNTDIDANTKVAIKGSAVGSGIRADTYDLDGPNKSGLAPKEGSVALITPRGILDLGEAGIGGGDVLIIANDVVGFGGIDSTGSVTGAPVSDTGGLGSSLAGAGVADAAKQATEDVTRQVSQNANAFTPKNLMPSIVSVEVIGLGE